MRTLTLFLLSLLLACACKLKDEPQNQYNILFLAIDDLRPELACYGSPIAITPHIDNLASQGLVFDRAYCQQAICSPSRASLMTGARPESIGVIENFTDFREVNPDIQTLPMQLMKVGYETVHTGKIFHGKYNDAKLSWSRKAVYPKNVERAPTKGGYALLANQEAWLKNKAGMIEKYGPNATRNGLGQGPAYECADVPDATYEDGYNTVAAIATLKDMVTQNPDKPFFLGLGFKKPHLNFNAPKKYWDLYERNAIPMAQYNNAPENGAKMGLHPSFELRARSNIPKYGELPDTLARALKHGYLACVSYVDAQIGMMLDALEEVGKKDETIIILWTDHGWHLGDMGIWGKATNYEISTRVPLIIWTPNMPNEVRGVHTDALVELVDMYPTLCELVGAEIPATVEGQSFAPLLKNPNQKWKSAVFSQFPTPALREWAANPLSKGMRETYFGPLIEDVEAEIKTQQGEKWDREFFENYLMGYGMRTDQYRLVVWKDYRDKNAEPVMIELYDHVNDPNETENIAADKSDVVEKLYQQFLLGWEGNRAKLN